MNRYLDLLKGSDLVGAGGGASVQERQMTNHQNLHNPVQGGSDGFVGRSDGTRAHSHPAARMAPTDTTPPVRAARWLVHYADRESMEVHFAPAADHAEILAAYTDAVAAEPMPEVRTPVRNEVHTKTAARGCSTCRHRRRPGLSLGYCGGRDDLPPAYGDHHPLRKLPDDQGVNCDRYRPHEG